MTKIAVAPYRAAPWLIGPHLQTIVPALVPRQAIAYRRERLDTPDGDFVDLDWTDTAPVGESPPTVLLFHGLEGSSSSHYALELMRATARLRWQGVVAHFRGCSGEINRAPRFYHSGDRDEIAFAIAQVRRRVTGPLYVAGVSLGGNALLVWLASEQDRAAQSVTAAASLCAPLDLAAGGAALGRGFNRVYTNMFLRSLKVKSAAKLRQHPGLFDMARMRSARNLWEFDNVVTAPLHGFRDTNDYWSRASSKPMLGSITVPTLILNAKNDPFQPYAAWPLRTQLSASITFETPDEGGHVGFRTWRGNREDWLSARVLEFFGKGQ